MSIQELGYAGTPLGELTLRRRFDVAVGREVFEVKLGDEYLMSSLFTEAERQLAVLGLAGLEGELDVVVGGLGLRYTAAEALSNERVGRLLVIDLFQPVIDWHRAGLVPNGEVLTADARCELRQGDFFALARDRFDTGDAMRSFDAVLLDIDHSPKHFLDAPNESFYSAEGLASVRRQLRPGGRFALWSNDRADDSFTSRLAEVFGAAEGHDVEFPNPYTGATSVNSVYVAQARSQNSVIGIQ